METSVVGFDIGNENCVIAVAKQRGVDVLLNDESKRENPAVVSFGEKQRFLGSSGAASATMHPKSTISQFKRLIGRNFSEPSVHNDLRLLPFETSEGPDGGILIHLQYLNERHTFTPVQILAMLLAHLKQITEKNLEMQIANCVIGVPSYFSGLQRRAYLHAAQIAGLSPARLMHDCTAVALGYGIYKTEFPNKVPANVVFVDVGHSDTQVAVVSFEPSHMKVLSHAFDSNLGGRDFDEVLFKHFAALFREQHKIDVYSSPRASVRLRAACEKLKKVLSANPEAPLNIECLMEEKDVKGHIKRDEFEKLASELLERFRVPCCKALHESGLSVEKIHTVELVGSGSRIPAITKMLNSLFRREPGRTLNASECVARGCALQCAMLSPVHRVREYEVEDRFPFSIAFASDEGPIRSLADGVLFPKGNSFPSTKILTLYRNDVFHMEAYYANKNELPSGVSTRISSFKIGPFRISNEAKTKIKVKVQLDLHGIVTIVSASLVEDDESDSSANNVDTLSNVESSDHESFKKASGTSGHEMRRLKAVRRQNILVDENIYGGMSHFELCQAQEKELQLAQQDMKMEMTKEKKNALEAYVYETRNKLLDTYRSFATESEKEGISSNLQQTEDWLYEDGDDESDSVYTERLRDLKKMVGPIENRYKDEAARAQASRNLLDCIKEYRRAAGSLSPNARDAVIRECNNAELWLQEKIKQQDLLPKNADPIVWSTEITKKAEALDVQQLDMEKLDSQSNSPNYTVENLKYLKHMVFKHATERKVDGESDKRGKRDDMEVD